MTMTTTESIAEEPEVMAGEGKTPPRSSLARDPQQTPIASIKRPRNASRSPMPTPLRSSTRSLTSESPISPMHGVKNVHREEEVKHQVDTIFSPVAHFLETADDEDSIAHPEIADDDFNPWQFIKSLPDYESVLESRPAITLPPKTDSRKSLVLDLDETLVHCTVETPDVPADLTFPVDFHGVNYTVHVRLRPYLMEFLKSVKDFEVIVFTASQKVYADALLNLIDPDNKYIDYRLFRESCLAVEGNYLKDLNVLGRDLKTTVLVDNSPHAFGYQIDNGIPIESWFDDASDRELLKLSKFLRQKVLPASDVTVAIREKFGSQKLVDEAPPLNLS